MKKCDDFSCGNARPGEPYDPTRDCRKCWAALHHPAVARSLGRTSIPVRTPPRKPAARPPCAELGGYTGGAVSCATCGGNVRIKLRACRVYGACTEAKKVDGVACCAGGKCKGYRPKPDLITIPAPPPVSLTPARPRAVVTVAAGPEGRALFALSRPWLSAYAGRLDADLVVLDWCVDSHPIYSKFQLYRVIDAYPPGTRFAFIDADTAADPGACPDLFSLVPPGEFGVYDDLPGLRRLKANGVIREYQDFRAAVGLAPLPAVPWYGNTGVMVFGPEHRDVFAPPAGPIPRQHCGEQHWWTARLHDSGCKVRFLPPECNYQWWEHKSDPPPGVIRHFSGMRPHKSAAERLALMSLSAAGW